MSEIRTFPSSLFGKENFNNNWSIKWNTTAQASVSGRIRTLTQQLYPTLQTYLYYPHLTDSQAEELEGFINLCRGSGKFFWYKDYQRSKISNQVLSRSTSGTYQCITNIGGFVEPVYRVEAVKIYINGVETTSFSEENGILVIPDAKDNHTVTADYIYYLKCYTPDDGITIRRNNAPNTNNASLNICVAR